MPTIQVVTGMVVNSVRRNDDGSIVLVVTVTYSDASTDTLEWSVDRLIP